MKEKPTSPTKPLHRAAGLDIFPITPALQGPLPLPFYGIKPIFRLDCRSPSKSFWPLLKSLYSLIFFNIDTHFFQGLGSFLADLVQAFGRFAFHLFHFGLKRFDLGVKFRLIAGPVISNECQYDSDKRNYKGQSRPETTFYDFSYFLVLTHFYTSKSGVIISGVGVFFSRQADRSGASNGQRAIAAEKGKTRSRLLLA
jgi:hypothetical protein